MESTISETLRHVLLLARHLRECDLRGVTIVALMELGVPTKSAGFEYLKRAILLQQEDPTRALTKDIYFEISVCCKLNSEEQVEKAIREAIRIAWENGSQTAWHWYFSYDGLMPCRKPTNGEFIARITNIVKLRMKEAA
jgi:hypothetical protein